MTESGVSPPLERARASFENQGVMALLGAEAFAVTSQEERACANMLQTAL